ncbi:M14/M99 family metallopeptidase [Salidesulfovibrio onnuriiensis]|uniref:M14/M99 family metallopeptidase n=1 Tax=Salidesulfovibrio onnuriiensis TaxID=2583823 RepID=UPI00202B7561|nr:M14/M99 family metallopeptidase [Salidesulfovibrio onnuriiensis]
MFLAVPASAGSWEYVFFKGTQYPLKVVSITGDLPGPTVMVQGGIQGDETSGFVTAQLLSRSRVLRGNLIVLPRANVPSINLRKRQINVDMNRRFDRDYNRFYEDRVARVIRFLLAKSDAFIHLHEGSGFYNPTYIDNLRNPKRYGQSIIVDTLVWKGSKRIELGRTASEVLERINTDIPSSDYKFKLFNTKTFDTATSYPEMRKSLTCYALAEHNIPAMAVEVSKDIIQLDWKVRHQLLATTMLLSHFGVDVVLPEFSSKDVLAYARKSVGVKVNGRSINNGSTIRLAPGATLAVEPMQRGLDEFEPAVALFASDRPGVNLLDAQRMVLEPFSQLELRVDGSRVARANVKWTGPMPSSPGEDAPTFVCWLNGTPTFVRHGEVLRSVLGDQLILEGIWGSRKREIVNLKGFVAIPWDNNGQDLGWEIILDPGNFLRRYALDSDREGAVRFKVVRETPGEKEAYFYVDIAPRRVHALRLADSKGNPLLIPWTRNGLYRLPEGEYLLEEAWSNGPNNKLITEADGVPLHPGDHFMVTGEKGTQLMVRQATTFGELGSMTFSSPRMAQQDTGRSLTY